jgi:hypothetical protein
MSSSFCYGNVSRHHLACSRGAVIDDWKPKDRFNAPAQIQRAAINLTDAVVAFINGSSYGYSLSPPVPGAL